MSTRICPALGGLPHDWQRNSLPGVSQDAGEQASTEKIICPCTHLEWLEGLWFLRSIVHTTRFSSCFLLCGFQVLGLHGV